ncbi:MIEAP domain-containing protein [Aix galericulata]|nr:MIEAP domain-containing protein [Aix galericulata]
MVYTRHRALSRKSVHTQTDCPLKTAAVQVSRGKETVCVRCRQVDDLVCLVAELKEELERLRDIRKFLPLSETQCRAGFHWGAGWRSAASAVWPWLACSRGTVQGELHRSSASSCKMPPGTPEVSEGILHTSWQKSACGNTTSRTEALYTDMMERQEKVEKELRVIQKDLEEENQKMKEKIKRLEARNNELLSKMMSMHKQSENMNDPSRLSAVVQLYEMLRLRDWEKFKKSSPNVTYKNGRSIIKKLFDTCEKDIEKRKNDIFNILDVSFSNYAMANCKQELTSILTNLLRNVYCQHHSDFYKKITKESPVKAVWHKQEIHPEELEHVDKKDLSTVHWKKAELLWPVLKSGEELVAKGVQIPHKRGR